MLKQYCFEQNHKQDKYMNDIENVSLVFPSALGGFIDQ